MYMFKRLFILRANNKTNLKNLGARDNTAAKSQSGSCSECHSSGCMTEKDVCWECFLNNDLEKRVDVYSSSTTNSAVNLSSQSSSGFDQYNYSDIVDNGSSNGAYNKQIKQTPITSTNGKSFF